MRGTTVKVRVEKGECVEIHRSRKRQWKKRERGKLNGKEEKTEQKGETSAFSLRFLLFVFFFFVLPISFVFCLLFPKKKRQNVNKREKGTPLFLCLSHEPTEPVCTLAATCFFRLLCHARDLRSGRLPNELHVLSS
jgi:hypothetical protein